MKTALVPAQITTVEDRITGRLTLQQMLLLVAPVFVDFAIYACVPHLFKLTGNKLALMLAVSFICCLLAIRIKDRIILVWFSILYRYYRRPQYYIFNKNDRYLRQDWSPVAKQVSVNINSAKIVKNDQLPQLSSDEKIRIETNLEGSSADLSFTTHKKGRLYVSLLETK